MKKLMLLWALLLPLLSLISCGSDKDEPIEKPDNTNSIQSQLIGVWKFDNYVISFNEDGFYSAYTADEFLDSGTYSISTDEKSIICKNQYFSRTTTYHISNITDKEISLSFDYINCRLIEGHNDITLIRTDIQPATKENPLIGKSLEYLGAYGFGKIKEKFETYNIGTKTGSGDNVNKYPLTFFYIYIGDMVYYQYLSGFQVPTIGGWPNAYYKVIGCRALFEDGYGFYGLEKVFEEK